MRAAIDGVHRLAFASFPRITGSERVIGLLKFADEIAQRLFGKRLFHSFIWISFRKTLLQVAKKGKDETTARW